MVRLNSSHRPDPIELGESDEVILTHSSSSPGSFHVAARLAKPVATKRFGIVTIICSCRGFQTHGKCWHAEHLNNLEDEHELDEAIETGDVLDPFEGLDDDYS